MRRGKRVVKIMRGIGRLEVGWRWVGSRLLEKRLRFSGRCLRGCSTCIMDCALSFGRCLILRYEGQRHNPNVFHRLFSQIKPSSIMMGHTEYLPLPIPESQRLPSLQQPFTGQPRAAPQSAGPKTYTRTQRPPTYFICDYSQARVTEPWGMNRWYSLDEWHAYGRTKKSSEPPRIASEPNVGGYVDVHPANDLWYLGNLFDTKFLQVRNVTSSVRLNIIHEANEL